MSPKDEGDRQGWRDFEHTVEVLVATGRAKYEISQTARAARKHRRVRAAAPFLGGLASGAVIAACLLLLVGPAASWLGGWLGGRQPPMARKVDPAPVRVITGAAQAPITLEPNVAKARETAKLRKEADSLAQDLFLGSLDVRSRLAALDVLVPATFFVPTVKGAPGDGNVALTSAIKDALSSKGITIAMTETTLPTPYRVEGSVTIKRSEEGKEAITIEWIVFDGSGRKLGTVSQKNELPKSSLDGSWAVAAAQVAVPAAQVIISLLPESEVGLGQRMLDASFATRGQLCLVWTASYGGPRSAIIRSTTDQLVNYTVLGVSADNQARETEKFFSAYGAYEQGGEVIGTFSDQRQALDRAFELCPHS